MAVEAETLKALVGNGILTTQKLYLQEKAGFLVSWAVRLLGPCVVEQEFG